MRHMAFGFFIFLLALSVSAQAKPAGPRQVTIFDTIERVLNHHGEFKGILENRIVLKEEVARAKAGYGPRVDLQGSAGGAVINDSSTRRRDLNNSFLGVVEGSAKITQPVWDGFATKSRVASAKSTFESVDARVLDTATSLSLDGIIAQIDVNRRNNIYQLAKKNVANHKSILAQAQDRANFGVDTQVDVSQAQSRLHRALSSLAEAQAAMVNANNTYSRLTGVTNPSNLAPVPMPPKVYKSPSAAMLIAEKSNPKIKAYIKDIDALKADRDLAKASYSPTLNIEAGPTYSNRNSWDDRWSFSFDAMGVLRWNIFNSGADKAEVRAASARIRQGRQALNNYNDQLKLDIESAYTNYLAAKDMKKNYQEALKYNRHTRTAFMEEFQMGQRSLLDVLDAENEFFNSSVQAETASGNILVEAWKMCALTGELLPALKITHPEIHN